MHAVLTTLISVITGFVEYSSLWEVSARDIEARQATEAVFIATTANLTVHV